MFMCLHKLQMQPANNFNRYTTVGETSTASHVARLIAKGSVHGLHRLCEPVIVIKPVIYLRGNILNRLSSAVPKVFYIFKRNAKTPAYSRRSKSATKGVGVGPSS